MGRDVEGAEDAAAGAEGDGERGEGDGVEESVGDAAVADLGCCEDAGFCCSLF